VNQAILAWSFNILCRQMLRADQADLAWFTTHIQFGQLFCACRESKTTKPILLDSLHITSAIYVVNQAILAWSFKILCCRQMLRADQADIAWFTTYILSWTIFPRSVWIKAILAWSFKILCRQMLILFFGGCFVPWDVFLWRFVPWDVFLGRSVPWDV
jgi:hypothetical protein